MARALVLNASFEPLGVVSARRALVLVLSGKAVVLRDTGRPIHSARAVYVEPSVVRLERFVYVPRQRRVSLTRRAIFARDGHRCQYCGALAENIDHVVPRSRGGAHTWENVVASCRRKGNKKK
jgi:5-methylcytosine-specific restriction endonuclease McrA